MPVMREYVYSEQHRAGGSMEFPRIITSGDTAIVVEFEDRIDPSVNAKVKAFYETLKNSGIEGIVDIIPTYRSVLVHYNPLVIRYGQMMEQVERLLNKAGEAPVMDRKIYKIPVCYGGYYGQDLEDVAEHAGMTQEEVIRIHSGRDYLIYMLGFQPGFAYLGGMDERIAMPRLPQPRGSILAGSVGIANSQTGIYPMSSPAGWRLIGCTPVRPYDARRSRPILYEAGDYIRFVPISERDYTRIEVLIEQGSYECPVEILKA